MKKLTALCLVLAAVLLAACAAAEPFRTESGVKFGMTEQEIADLEAAAGREMKGPYQDRFSTWIWFDRDILLESLACSSVQYALDGDGRMYMACYICAGGEQDYSFLKSLLTDRYGDPVDDPEDPDKTGGISLLYSHKYEEDGRSSHREAAHWGVSDGKSALGIDLWYNEFMTVYAVFWDASSPASCNTTPKTYSDASGISFPYLERWLILSESEDPRKIEFVAADDGFCTLEYIQMDFRSPGEPVEVPGMDYLDHTMVSWFRSQYNVQNLRTEFHNGAEYRVFEYRDGTEGEVIVMPFDMTVAMTLQDGIFHMFRLTAPPSRHDPRLPGFMAFLDSVSFEK